MMKTTTQILLMLSVLFLSEACQRDNRVKIDYEATEAVSEYTLSFKDESGALKTIVVEPAGKEDKWNYSMMAEEGEIVYVSGKYNDAGSSLRLRIMLDGKTYKEGYSTGDTIKYLVVSGVVPYGND
jgi:hypothetical protein